MLRRRPYGESSLIVQLAAEQHGRLHVMAKGAYRPTSGYCGVLDLFDTLEVQFHAGARSGLAQLGGASIATRRRALTRELWRYRAGLFALELHELACQPALGESAPFELLEFTLDQLCAARAPAAIRPIATAHVLRLLSLLGLTPALERCAACGRGAPPVTPDGLRAAFSASCGGRLCLACARSARAAGRRVGSLPVEVLDRARRLLEEPPRTDALSGPGPSENRMSPDAAPGVEPRARGGEDSSERALADFVQRFLEYHLEYRPRVRLEDL